MIERFNFYDVYGYFIPGSVLILAIWLPFAMTGHAKLPTGEWPLLVVGVLVAYLAGHLIQTMASTAIPSSGSEKREKWAYPSARMVSADDKSTFTDELKDRIEKCVHSWFDLEIHVKSDATEPLGKIRQDAFELSRRVVVKTGNYSEQFQGLYVMMRGITAALWLATPYTLGWVLVLWSNTIAYSGSVILVLLAAAKFAHLSYRSLGNISAEQRIDINRSSLFVLAVGLFFLGYVLGKGKATQPLAYSFGGIAVFYVGVSLRSFSSCQYFAREFAKSVWIQFASSPMQRSLTNAGETENV